MRVCACVYVGLTFRRLLVVVVCGVWLERLGQGPLVWLLLRLELLMELVVTRMEVVGMV